jgi:tRNA(Ile)-lysidine synthase
MSSKLHQEILSAIRQHRMSQAGDRVGVAVSGGGDSVALLLLLLELRAELGVSLLVLHFNHQLRGADSDADEQFVADLACSHGLELISTRRDVSAEARRLGQNLEEVARQLRYGFFNEVAESGRVTRVAVAHTADDQAETVLARLLRGTGPSGLAGIYPVVGAVVRPLLGVRRAALRAYLNSRGQVWREDASNRDPARLRARIRHTLLPLLEAEFQPALTDRLAALATTARSEESFWRALEDDTLRRQLRGGNVKQLPRRLAVSIPDLLEPMRLLSEEPTRAHVTDSERRVRAQELCDALSRRMVRRLFEVSTGSRHGLTSEHVEQVLRLARRGAGGTEIHLPGVVVERSLDGDLVFVPRSEETRVVLEPYEYAVDFSSVRVARVNVPQIGKRFVLKVIDWPGGSSETRQGGEPLDFERLRVPVVLRNWRPGDAYRPRGRQRVHKLKELLYEGGVDVRERPAWPVLTSAGQVVWARGLPGADEYAANPATHFALLIDEESL